MQQNPYIDAIDKLVEKVMSRIEQEIPRSGYFAPVYENFYNYNNDAEKRYIEASVFDSGGCYKTEMLVGSGNKEEIIALMKTEKFRQKLYDTYIRLLDMLRD